MCQLTAVGFATTNSALDSAGGAAVQHAVEISTAGVIDSVELNGCRMMAGADEDVIVDGAVGATQSEDHSLVIYGGVLVSSSGVSGHVGLVQMWQTAQIYGRINCPYWRDAAGSGIVILNQVLVLARAMACRTERAMACRTE